MLKGEFMNTIKPNLRTKITRYISNAKYNREQKNINKYLDLNDNIGADAYNQLYSAKKTIANYAKSKGVTIEIADAESLLVNDRYEFDIDERFVQRAAKNNLKVTIRPLKKLPMRKGGRLLSTSEFVSKDTSKTHLHTVDNFFMVEIPSDGLQQTRVAKVQHEDNFLRNIYRTIESRIKAFQQFRK